MKELTREQTWRKLRELKAVQAIVEFSGGGDEGGPNNVTLKLADGTERSLAFYMSGDYNKATGKWDEGPPKGSTVEEVELGAALSQPVDSEYGSFAGEFYVSGTVIWDVATGKISMSGSEEVPQSDSFHREF